jgi:hypothetical protein
MGNDSKFASSQTETGAPEVGGTTPALKTWVTPRVIVAALASEDTESNGSLNADNVNLS